MSSVEIQLNGEPYEVPGEHTVAQLVEQLELRPELVAVEVNQTLVPRARRAETTLRAGDRVEFVTLVGGG